MIAAHLDSYLFLLFVAVWIFFQLLTRVATKSGRRTGGDLKRRSTSPPQTPRSIPGQPEETDEDRIRKFLEALGQPTTSKPPPPVAQRPTYQKPVVLPRVQPRPVLSPLPPLTTRPPDLPSPLDVPIPQSAEAAASVPPLTAQTISKSAETKIDIARLLRTTSGLRDAIILREIFGPPRSMQPFDLAGNV
jgi:hypothetical protein